MSKADSLAAGRCGIRNCGEPANEIISGDEMTARCSLHSQDPAWKKRAGRKRVQRIGRRVELKDLRPGE